MIKIKFYVPGLLSLLLLFPLLLYQLLEQASAGRQHVLEVNWYSPTIANPYAVEFPARRDYTTIALTGNAQHDNTKIEFAKILVNEMITRFDTVRGVRINFADAAKYESFIKVLDFCNQQEGLAYAPYENDFWIFNRYESEEQKNSLRLGNCIITTPVKFTKAKEAFSWIDPQLDKRFWPIDVLFILLIILSVKRRF